MMKTTNRHDGSIMQRLSSFLATYKVWLVRIELLLILIFLYFQELVGGLFNVLMPAIVVTVLAILFDMLWNLDERLVDLQRQLQHYPTLADAVPLLQEAVKRDREITSFKIIAATGGTTLSTVLPGLINSTPAHNIEIVLMIVNPDGPHAHMFPSHWGPEVAVTHNRLRALCDGNKRDMRITLRQYDYLPLLHGIMVNNKYLLLGFFGWENASGMNELTGSQRPHLYYTRDQPDAEYFFALFDEWINESPQDVVFRYPDDVQAG